MSKVTSHPAHIVGNDASGEQPEAPRPPKSRRLPPGLALATVRCGAPWGSGPWSWEALTRLFRCEGQPGLGSDCLHLPILLINYLGRWPMLSQLPGWSARLLRHSTTWVPGYVRATAQGQLLRLGHYINTPSRPPLVRPRRCHISLQPSPSGLISGKPPPVTAVLYVTQNSIVRRLV